MMMMMMMMMIMIIIIMTFVTLTAKIMLPNVTQCISVEIYRHLSGNCCFELHGLADLYQTTRRHIYQTTVICSRRYVDIERHNMEISRRIYRKPFSGPKACLVGDTQNIVYSVHARSLEETGGNRRNVDCGVNLTCRNQDGKDHILRCERKNIRRRLI